MKKIYILWLLFFSIFGFSQNTIQIKKTWENDPVFEGGNQSLSTEISNTLKYVIVQNYFVDGKVTLLLKIDETGKYKVVSVYPTNLKNKDAFIDDFNYILKRSKKKWIPASTEGKPVVSYFIYVINFTMTTYDED